MRSGDQELTAGPATHKMLAEFDRLEEVLLGQRRMIHRAQQEGILTDELAEQMHDSLFCFELGMQFYAEANRAIQGSAWFAAMAIATSSLEALLLARCFTDQQRIKALPKWSGIKKSHRVDFSLFARSLDLGKLLEIAHQLAWFPEGVPDTFMAVFEDLTGKHAGDELRDLFKGTNNVGEACANHLREYRNMLHPAVCLRENRRPNELSGQTGTLMLMIAISCLAQG